MSDALVGLVFGIGLAAWVYAQMYRRTGGNNKSALTVAGLCGLVGFLFILILLGILF
jgi:hypothetical protein